jgi:hypothetical protein
MTKLWVRFLALLATLGALTGAALVPAPEASAVPCAPRSAAHVAEHGGMAEDSRWHVANGQLPTCNEEASSARENDNPDRDRDGKSRYCRRHWFC